MKAISLFLTLFLVYSSSLAQNPKEQYTVILHNIERTFAAEQFDSTLLHIRAARAWAPEKEAEIEAWNERVFDAIKAQRDRAERAEAAAKESARRANAAAKKAAAAEKKAEEKEAEAIAAAETASAAEAEAKRQAERAEAVLDKIYFYAGSFGLASELDSYSNLKYSFIDKELNTKIDFQYDEALPFDYTGFARVKKIIKTI